ncbi:MAG TPA: acetyl-CoA acetyltransferase [Dehalococcoidia bacterium]|nr:acetyl-CoA acetyltransferase [Dehalococcoidia bacterium]
MPPRRERLTDKEKASLFKKVAIAGVDESDEIGIVPHKSTLQLQAEAARNALADAGIPLSEVDGIFTTGAGYGGTLQVAEYLGITPTYTDSTAVGGSSFVIHVEHAAAAIAAGLIDVALIVHGESGHSGRLRGLARPQPDPWSPAAQFEAPYHVGGPATVYALACQRHMHQYGTTHEQLAEIAVATRKWAQLNPKALMRDPLTIDDVLSSRWIAYPFHIYDCCLVTDAGGAVVVTGAARARDCKKDPVWVLGSGEAHTHATISQMPDLTTTPAAISGPRAFQMAGVRHEDIDVVEVYDSFTYTALVTLEALGFCKPGEGGPFVSGQRTAPGGEFPLNTAGGGLSYTHPGQYGIFLIIEAVRQLRGECGERQVPDARLACVNGTGGTLSSAGTLILGAG